MNMSLQQSIVVGILAVLMAIAVFTDVRARRVPNWLTVTGAFSGLALHTVISGLGGAILSVGGMAVGFTAMLLLYVFGTLGAGDVKLMTAAGSFLGPLATLWAAVLTVLAGFVIAIGIILIRGGATSLWNRWRHTIKALLVTGTWLYVPPQPDEPAAIYFPYAAAIAAGVLTSALAQLHIGGL